MTDCPDPEPRARRLDLRGEFCPVPIIALGQAIKAAAAGEVIAMIADDPVVEKDVRAWCRASRQTLLRLEKQGNAYHIEVLKTR